ncbi:MAG: 2-(1,2-epoxy-1,2-dihydrophenyl)acetyl-CoA isomerase PaaG [Hyphomicrobiaceae bacterium]|nr:2-(1,2-epoxy-1,2-dihydrophenyl)acetyl-CoA isomerase PaaG [Hyphomicrobiaceae bacterium]
MTDTTVLVSKAKGVTTLTLNRPDKLNAFNTKMHLALRAGLEAAAGDADCRVIVLTGAGRAFSAGQDLADSSVNTGGGVDAGAALETLYNPLIKLITGLEKPIIAAVNGVAAGASANIALACDLVYAAKSASFLQAFMRIGLIPDAGGTYTLTKLLGPARARGLAILAEPLPAEKAEAWGLIWRAVEDDKFQAEVAAVAERLASAPTYAIGLTKQAIAAAATNTLSQQLALECDLQRLAGASHDAREGIAAFLEKRPARFTGSRS